ncbi:MAG: archease [Thermodesulfobacteriota bacterium]
MCYEILDHTADVCVRVYGKSFNELIKNAAYAMMDLVTDREKIKTSKQIEIRAEGQTKEELLVHWLQEILFLHQTKKMVFRDFEVNMISKTTIKGKALGEQIDLEKHELFSDIKAVTYHNLKVESLDDRLKVEIVFDI